MIDNMERIEIFRDLEQKTESPYDGTAENIAYWQEGNNDE